MRELLTHMATLAKPREGATKILVPICQMASKRCTWVDGGLVVEINEMANGERTKIVVALDIGGGSRELLIPKLDLEVPWNEFASAIETAPRLVEPMKVRVKKRSVLLAVDAELISTVAPPSFAIAEESWRRSLPPAVRRSLAPPVAIDMPHVGEAELLKGARLKAPAAPIVAEDDLVDLRTLGRVTSVGASTEGRMSRRPTKKPTSPPKKKIVIRKKR
jgi:hypothetical protein